MEFLLTSTMGGVENQIPNAVIKKYTKIEVRNFSSFEEFDKRLSWFDGDWLSNGLIVKSTLKKFLNLYLLNHYLGNKEVLRIG